MPQQNSDWNFTLLLRQAITFLKTCWLPTMTKSNTRICSLLLHCIEHEGAKWGAHYPVGNFCLIWQKFTDLYAKGFQGDVLLTMSWAEIGRYSEDSCLTIRPAPAGPGCYQKAFMHPDEPGKTPDITLVFLHLCTKFPFSWWLTFSSLCAVATSLLSQIFAIIRFESREVDVYWHWSI